MKSSFVFFAATVCFLLGLGFYHYLLGYRALFNGTSRKPLSYLYDGPGSAAPLSSGFNFITSYHKMIADSFNFRDFGCTKRIKNISGSGTSHEWIAMQDVLKGPFAQNDSRLLSYIIGKNIIRPPSKKPYNLSNPDTDPSMGQSRIVRHALNGLKNGFFVECGALDGELRSNTLFLEKRFGWKVQSGGS